MYWNLHEACKTQPATRNFATFVIFSFGVYNNLPMQHVELFNYEGIAFETVEKRFLPSRR